MDRRAITGAWRVLQILALSVVVVAFYKVVRNFNRPALPPARAVLSANRLIFMNYVAAMSAAQEKVSAVIHKNDLTDIAGVTDRALQTPAPDARAIELRTELLVILAKLENAAAKAKPSPSAGEGAVPKLDDAEFKEWQKKYNEWLKGAAKTYTAAQ